MPITLQTIAADCDLGYTCSEDGGRTWQRIEAVTRDAAERSAHYVAPQVAVRGREIVYVCTSQSASPASSVYQGALEKPE